MTKYDQQLNKIDELLRSAIELASQVHEGLLTDMRYSKEPMFSFIERTGLGNIRLLSGHLRHTRDIAIGGLGRINTIEAMAASAPTPGHGHDHSH